MGVAVSDDDFKQRGAERRNGPSLGEYLETRLKLLEDHLDAAMAATDLRHEQRFQAQQIANQTALVAVEKALHAALAEANQRSLGLVSRIDEVAKRIDTLSSRFDTLAGQLAGGGSAGKSFEGRMALAFSGIVLLVVLWRVVTGH